MVPDSFAESRAAATRQAHRARVVRRRLPERLLAWLAAALLIGLLGGAGPRIALAKGPSYQDRIVARELGGEGLRLFEAGRYEEALERFERANEIFPAPTLGLRAARCLVKLGRLVEASERLLEVSRHRLTKKSPRVHYVARRQARNEREALLPQIPTLQVEVPDADPDSLLVRVDGERVPSAMVGQPQPLDPGDHTILVQRGTTEVGTSTALSKGEHIRLVVQLLGSPAYREVKEPRGASSHRETGLVALGIGGGAAGIATINGVVTLALWDNLEESCGQDATCPENLHSTNHLYRATGIITTVSMVVAGLGLAAGTTLLLTDPGPEEKLDLEASRSTFRLTPWFGPGGAGIAGQF